MLPCDIIDWLQACVNQLEAGGYQEFEACEDTWYKDGPPQITFIDFNTIKITCSDGEEVFTVTVRRKKKV